MRRLSEGIVCEQKQIKKYEPGKLELGEPTGKFYRGDPTLEYRLVMMPHGVHVFVTTNGAFPAWQITDEPFLSWTQAREWFDKNKKLCDKCKIGDEV
jgi:hypothetical protein